MKNNNKRNKAKRKAFGFTLVELIVVIAIIGILAAVLVPSIIGYVTKAKISNAVSDATNLTKQLTIDAIYDDVSYYPLDTVVEKAEEYGYDLDAGIDGYSFWYDASNNKVEFLETESAASEGTGDSASEVAYFYDSSSSDLISLSSASSSLIELGSSASYPIQAESLSSQSGLYFIDQSDTAYRTMIDVINNLADLGEYDVSTMETYFENALAEFEEDDDDIESAVSHFELYSTEYTIYVVEDEIIYDFTKSEFTNAVICDGVSVISASGLDSSITVTNSIAIPGSVTLMEGNAFKNVAASLTVVTSVVISSTISSTVTINNKSGSNVYSTTISLSSGAANIVYGYQKEAIDLYGYSASVYNADGVSLVNSSSTVDDTYTTLSNAIKCEYMLPTITVSSSLLEQLDTAVIKAKKVDGGIEYTFIGVDSANNAYEVEKIGAITSVGISYDYDSSTSAILTVKFGDLIEECSNLSDLYFTLEYQAGYAEFSTYSNPFGVDFDYLDDSDGFSWNSSLLNSVSSYTVSSCETQVSLDLNGITVDSTNAANVVRVTKICVYNNNGVLIYVGYPSAEN